MPDFNRRNEKLVFGLDIGTRSIVGSVGYLEKNKFNVIAHYVKEHDTRAMLDGQIHDISKVTDTILKVKKELEAGVGEKLSEVCIAAAGRVLKTLTVHIDYEIPTEQQVSSELVYSLDLLGVEKAYDIIREQEKDIKFYCVGYSVIKYYLNDYEIINLEGHKAKKISADVLATFLPEDVVDGLYTAVEGAELTVANLTLEPIAAINIAIPQNYRLLNIALVDVGAGTSDISITKDGSIMAYGMIPHAGDEITESLVSKYLVDFNTAETIKRASVTKKQATFKDIMGIKQKITAQEIRNVYEPVIDNMTREIAAKIKELNGGKGVSAVFIVGGGGKAYGFDTMLSKYLDLPKERVALRGQEVLSDVNFIQETVKKDPLLVTPIGICLSYYDQKNNFIFVNINDERIKLYDNDKLCVVDAAMQIGFPNDALFPRRGKELSFYVNDNRRMIRGNIGEAAVITINGEEANINSKIIKNDRIIIKESTKGSDASLTIDKLPEYNSIMNFIVNGKKIICPRFVLVNGELRPGDYEIKEDDRIKVLDYYTLYQISSLLDIDYENINIYVNNKLALKDDLVYENFNIDFNVDEYNSVNNVDEENDSKTDNEINTNHMHNEFSNDINIEDNSDDKLDVKVNNKNKDIFVIINGQQIQLKNKEKYIYVDIFDFYDFDMKVARGTELIKTINGESCEFTSPIKEGDIIEIYWRS